MLHDNLNPGSRRRDGIEDITYLELMESMIARAVGGCIVRVW